MNNSRSEQVPTFVDLFAGCGGLSLGLEKAGFRSVLAVEKSDMAAETYYHNFIKRLPSDAAAAKREWQGYLEASIESQAAAGLVIDEVASVLANRRVMDSLRSQGIDLVAGGPPCQGFSMAGRRDPSDVRNQLPWQFLEFVRELEPKAVIIENVVGIGQDFIKHGAQAPFGQLRLALEATGPGYVAQPLRLNAMHYGVPQHRPRMLLVAVRQDLAERAGLSTGLPLWRSENEEPAPLLAPSPCRDESLTVEDALWDLADDSYTDVCSAARYETKQGRFAREMRCDPLWLPPALPESPAPSEPLNHTRRVHTPKIKLRFELYQYLASQGVPSKIFNIPMDGRPDEEQKEAVRGLIQRCTYPACAPDGRRLADDSEELAWLVMSHGTKKHSQRPLNAAKPSPTIMSLPDDFVHYFYPRTLTIREVARLQSFPDQFEFRSKETTGSLRRRIEVPQYTQVGNAVPPKLGVALGERLKGVIDIAALSETEYAASRWKLKNSLTDRQPLQI